MDLNLTTCYANSAMMNKKPLTKQDLMEALKTLPTEEKMNEIVIEASHTVL